MNNEALNWTQDKTFFSILWQVLLWYLSDIIIQSHEKVQIIIIEKKIEEQYQSPAFPGILGEVNALQEWIVVAEQKPKVVDYKKPIDRRYLLSFCTDLFFKWPLWENVMFSCSLW